MVIFLKVPLSPCNIVIKEGHIFLTAEAAASSQTWMTVESWSRQKAGGRLMCLPSKMHNQGRCTVWWSPGFRDLERAYLFHSQFSPDTHPRPVFISSLSVQTIWINLLASAIRREALRCGAWWRQCQKHQDLMNGVLASEPSWRGSFAKSIQADSIAMLD